MAFFRNRFFFLALILFLNLILNTFHLTNRDLGTAWDEGFYAQVARNIAGDLKYLKAPLLYTNGVEIDHETYSPHARIIIDKPPLLMWLGGILGHLISPNIFVFRSVSIAASLIATLAFFLILQGFGNRRHALLATLIFATHPLLIAYSRVFMTDVLFLALVLLLSWILIKSLEQPKSYWLLLGLGFLSFLIFLTRQMSGFPLFLGFTIFIFLVKKQKSAQNRFSRLQILATCFLGIALSMLFWTLCLKLNASEYDAIWRDSSSSLTHFFSDPIERKYFKGSLVTLFKNLLRFSDYRFGGNFSPALLFPTLSLAAFGVLAFVIKERKQFAFIRQKNSIFVYWLLSYLPFQASHVHGFHYLVLLTPPIVFFTMVALTLMKRWLRPWMMAPIVVVIIAPSMWMIKSGQEVLMPSHYSQMAEYIKTQAHTNTQTTVASHWPTFAYYSKMPAVSHVFLAHKGFRLENYSRWTNIRFVEIPRFPRYLDQLSFDQRKFMKANFDWVEAHCTNVNPEIGLGTDDPFALFDCWRFPRTPAPWAITGRVVTKNKVLENGTLVVGGHLILDIVEGDVLKKYPNLQTRIETHATLYPGLINLYDHLMWNTSGPLPLAQHFESMGQFHKTKAFKKLKQKYAKERHLGGCELNDFLELIKLLSGETSMQSSFQYKCPRSLVRNLNDWNEFENLKILKDTNVGYFFGLGDAQKKLRQVANQPYVVSLAEGLSPSFSTELTRLEKSKRLHQKTLLVHGLSFETPEIEKMKNTGANYIWTLSSHMRIFGQTSSIEEILVREIPTALATDWLVTGSESLLRELKVAKEYGRKHFPGTLSDAALFAMVTEAPAKMLGLEGKLGELAALAYSDFIAIEGSGDPYELLTRAGHPDISWVVIDGVVQKGPHEAQTLNPNLIEQDVCGKTVYLPLNAKQLEKILRQKIPNIREIYNCP